MTMDYENIETITKNKCVECGDTLTFFELENGNYCLLCESENEND